MRALFCVHMLTEMPFEQKDSSSWNRRRARFNFLQGKDHHRTHVTLNLFQGLNSEGLKLRS